MKPGSTNLIRSCRRRCWECVNIPPLRHSPPRPLCSLALGAGYQHTHSPQTDPAASTRGTDPESEPIPGHIWENSDTVVMCGNGLYHFVSFSLPVRPPATPQVFGLQGQNTRSGGHVITAGPPLDGPGTVVTVTPPPPHPSPRGCCLQGGVGDELRRPAHPQSKAFLSHDHNCSGNGLDGGGGGGEGGGPNQRSTTTVKHVCQPPKKDGKNIDWLKLYSLLCRSESFK